MRTSPLLGRSRPSSIRIVVDLPAPFGPRKPVTTPGRTVKVRWSTAVLSPYRLVSPCNSIMGARLARHGGTPDPDKVLRGGGSANSLRTGADPPDLRSSGGGRRTEAGGPERRSAGLLRRN